MSGIAANRERSAADRIHVDSVEPPKWRLDRSFSLQSLLQALILAYMVFSAIASVDKRLSLLEASSARQDAALIELQKQYREDVQEIRRILEQRTK